MYERERKRERERERVKWGEKLNGKEKLRPNKGK